MKSPDRRFESRVDLAGVAAAPVNDMPPVKIAAIICRILLGLVFAVFGSNAFLHFLPMPPMSGPAGAFIGAMYATGYLKAVAVFQILGGLLLLLGRFVPLGLTLLGPIVLNIILYHLFMDRSGMPIALIVSVLWLYLLWFYRAAFLPLLHADVPQPGFTRGALR